MLYCCQGDNMKIIVVSDSHGKQGILDEIVQKHADADMFLHCGDIDEPEEYHPEYLVVKGNNDMFYDYPEQRIVTAGAHQIYMAHSHQFPYMRRKEMMAKAAREHHCDIFCYGHTHVAQDEKVDGVRLLNPGSVWRSRDGRPPSYAIMTLEKDSVEVEFVFLEQKKGKFFW